MTVPAPTAAELRRELLALYGVHAEAMHHEVTACLEEGADAAGLRQRRADMAAVALLLDHLGWEARPGPARVTGSRHSLAEALAALLAARAGDFAADPRGTLADEPALVEVGGAFWALVLTLASLADVAAPARSGDERLRAQDEL